MVMKKRKWKEKGRRERKKFCKKRKKKPDVETKKK